MLVLVGASSFCQNISQSLQILAFMLCPTILIRDHPKKMGEEEVIKYINSVTMEVRDAPPSPAAEEENVTEDELVAPNKAKVVIEYIKPPKIYDYACEE